MLLVFSLVTVVALCATAGAAWAAPEPVSISGEANDRGVSPESFVQETSVTATLDGSVASGALKTEAKVGSDLSGHIYNFDGEVTCVLDRGKRVTIGAFGTVTKSPLMGPPEETTLEGKYAQLLTIEFGEFVNPRQGKPPLTFSYGLLHPDYGVPSASPPSCAHASFKDQMETTGGKPVYISPTITRPRSGRITRSPNVTLGGRAEPNRPLDVYEVGQPPGGGQETTPGPDGRWTLEEQGLALGRHDFVASTVDGSEVPSNAVEVVVLP